ncbi:MAG: M23 family metallopeptidase [Deltaproteobacteria bacterium]|nr:M23 family metallopeptidase [Deltaproteobacteria bacterium]
MTKKYTIIISPSSLHPIKKFTLHQPTIVLILVSVAILVAFGIGGAYKFYEENQIAAKYLQVREEKKDLESAAETLSDIKKKETMIRNFLGLEQTFDEMTGTGGQGGPGVSGFDLGEHPPHENIAWAESPGLETTDKEDAYFEKALLLDKNLQEIVDFLQAQKEEFASLPTISPIAVPDAWISSGYGVRKSPFTGLKEFHAGIDISAMRGAPVIAPGTGTVSFAGKKGGYGNLVVLKHNNHYTTVYGHLLGFNVKKNDRVKRGDIIGWVGNTGRSTGYHLHYEILKDEKHLDPFTHLLDWRKKHLYAAKD